MKGESTIDWSDKRARAALLAGIVGDADRLLELSRQAQGELPEDSAERQRIVLDTDSQLITAVEVLPGNAPDNLGALELVEQSEANTGVPVEETMGDAAYGDGDTRQAFADAGRTLIARVPGRPNRSHFPKEDFRIDLESGSCTCPAGNVTRTIVPAGRRTDQMGRTYRLEAFRFDAAVCGACSLRP